MAEEFEADTRLHPASTPAALLRCSQGHPPLCQSADAPLRIIAARRTLGVSHSAAIPGQSVSYHHTSLGDACMHPANATVKFNGNAYSNSSEASIWDGVVAVQNHCNLYNTLYKISCVLWRCKGSSTDLISLTRPESITKPTSSMVMEVSATLVATTILRMPADSRSKTRTCVCTHSLRHASLTCVPDRVDTSQRMAQSEIYNAVISAS